MNCSIVDFAKDCQAKENITDEVFAKKIGLHRVSWSRIKHGKAKYGKKFITGMKDAYPGKVDIFLSTGVTIRTRERNIERKAKKSPWKFWKRR
jgi:hypothetical protein